MVERTAHNGFVAGSNPAKLKKMNNKLKTYRLEKLKYYLKKPNLIFFIYIPNSNVKNQLKLEQKLFKNNLKLYNIKNNLTKHVINNSIYSRIDILIKGPLSIITLKNPKKININIQKLLNFNSNISVLTIKLNKKIYSNEQIKTISTLNYKNNIKILNKTFKQLIKIPYYNLKK